MAAGTPRLGVDHVTVVPADLATDDAAAEERDRDDEAEAEAEPEPDA